MSDQPPINPYAPPREFSLPLGDVYLRDNFPQYKLFSVSAIGVAALVGNMVAAGFLMAINFRRVGRYRAANTIFIVMLIGWVILVSLSLLADDGTIDLLFTAANAVIGFLTAHRLQKDMVEEHMARGGRLSSFWWAILIALVISVVLAAILLPLYLVFLEPGGI